MKSIGIILFIFALMAPIGIIIGLTAAKQGPFVDIIFLSISGGTFIYISCTEIIAREFKKNDETGTRSNWHLWVKLLCVLLGIIVICSLWTLEGEGHNHGAEEGMGHDGHGHAAGEPSDSEEGLYAHNGKK
jgi:zinc transporter ZupT